MELEERFAELAASVATLTDTLLDHADLLRQNNTLLEQNARLRSELANTAARPAAAPVSQSLVPGGKRHQDAAALGRRPVGRPPKPREIQPDTPARILAPSISDGLPMARDPNQNGASAQHIKPTPRPPTPSALNFERPTPGTPQSRAAELISAEIDPESVDIVSMKKILGALCDAKVFPETLEARQDMVREAMVDISPEDGPRYEKFTSVPAELYPAMFASLGTRLGVFQAVPEGAAQDPVGDDEETEDWP